MKKEIGVEDLHEKAQRLIDRERVEGLTSEECRWLTEHLGICKQCSARAAETEAALRALKSISVAVPRGLAASAKLRMHDEATKLKQRRARNLALIAACAVSWAAGVASAPLLWKLCEWFGTALDLPRIVWVAGFFCWWFVPAAAAGLVILWVRGRAELEKLYGPLVIGSRSNKW